jgi:hypothetical protein
MGGLLDVRSRIDQGEGWLGRRGQVRDRQEQAEDRRVKT